MTRKNSHASIDATARSLMTPAAANAGASARLLICSLLAAGLQSCGGSNGGSPPVPSPSPTATIPGVSTPTLKVTTSAASITTSQALAVTVSATAATGSARPSGTIFVTSGGYGSLPATLANGTATVSFPAGVLPIGTDTLTAHFTSSNAASIGNASGTASVAVKAGMSTAVAATSTTVAAMGAPIQALPLANGDVLVSISVDPMNPAGTRSGVQLFTPGAGGLTAGCVNPIAASNAVAGLAIAPSGVDVGATVEDAGVDFLNETALQTCTATETTIPQGAKPGSFALAITPDGRYAFVANEYGVAPGASTDGNVGVVALRYDGNGNVSTSSSILGQIATGGRAIAGITLSPDGKRLYVTTEIASSTSSGAGSASPILARTTCAQGSQTGENNGLLTVIDVAKAEASANASAIVSTVDAGCSPVRIAETKDQNVVWVTARGDDRVLAFSTSMLEREPANALIGYGATQGVAPVGMQLFDNDRLLAVANSNRFSQPIQPGNFTILDAVPVAPTVAATLTALNFPRDVQVGPDGTTLYLTDYYSHAVQVIKTSAQ